MRPAIPTAAVGAAAAVVPAAASEVAVAVVAAVSPQCQPPTRGRHHPMLPALLLPQSQQAPVPCLTQIRRPRRRKAVATGAAAMAVAAAAAVHQAAAASAGARATAAVPQMCRHCWRRRPLTAGRAAAWI